jgi:putative NADPH-quinone reductase
MNILIITAHPSSQGFTHKIANTYSQAATEKGHTVEIIDLYKSPMLEYLTFSKPQIQEQHDIAKKYYQSKITVVGLHACNYEKLA